MKAIIKNQNLIPFAQPALQLGRQGIGDARDRNCGLSGFDPACGQYCDETRGEWQGRKGKPFGGNSYLFWFFSNLVGVNRCN